MSEELLETIEDGIATLTLNRPEVLNALNPSLMKTLYAALQRIAADSTIACVVLTGAGRGFCAGGDIKARARGARTEASSVDVVEQVPKAARAAQSFEDRVAWLRRSSEAARLLHDMGKPTIAMINGACAGAGLALAGACDLRYAGRSAVFTSAFARAGLSGDFGGSYFWTRILGTAKARELYLLSEKFDAQAAFDFGLVNRICDDDELRTAVMAVANRFPKTSKWSADYIKRNLNAAEQGTLAQILDLEALTQTLSSRALDESTREREGSG